jgi:hypothetical protein
MSSTTPPAPPVDPINPQSAGRRRKRFNPWLAHVKNTMKVNRGVSFKKILKLAKKTFKKSKRQSQSQSRSRSQSQSQSQSQSGGKKNRPSKRGGFKLDQLLQQQQQQKGGSGVGGGKEGAATLAGSAAEVV